MSTFLLLATPLFGHVAPVVTIGHALVVRGHRVAMLTGQAFREVVQEHGMTFLPLPPGIDLDDARLDRQLADRKSWPPWAAGRDAVISMFVDTIEGQAAAVDAALRTCLAGHRYDVVICDTAFLGVQPLLLSGVRAAPTRPPVLGISATPLSVVSAEGAPFNSGLRPGDGPFTRLRNRQVNWLLEHGPMRPLHDAVNASLAPYGIPAGRLNYFDHVTTFDTTFHLGIAELEYPRREPAGNLCFVGPLQPLPRSQPRRPGWWTDLDRGRPVVHVTQGTMDNADLRRLIVPAVEGLAAEDVLVVVATGGRPAAAVEQALGRALPANVRVAEFLPYEALLPRVQVMITNGGYGGVQQAVRHGVPLVVAGSTEDKPEVAARVAWAGVGLNLRTGRPRAPDVRRAVRKVLRDPRFADRAAQLSAAARPDRDPLDRIVAAAETAARALWPRRWPLRPAARPSAALPRS